MEKIRLQYDNFNDCDEELILHINEFKYNDSAYIFHNYSTFELLNESIWHYANDFIKNNADSHLSKVDLYDNLDCGMYELYDDFLIEFNDLFNYKYINCGRDIRKMYRYDKEINKLIRETLANFKENY